MSVNDDGIQSGSDSFWEVGKYMRTVKRVDNGFELCNSMRRLITERAEIEKKYSSMLSEWAKKWNNFLDKGSEYGTTQGAWRGVLTEADHAADLHTEMGDRLMQEVYAAIKVWQKDNYHKSMMHFKETKEFEDNFRKAQKPWGKRLTKVIAAKKDYHAACRTEKSTANQENNARGDTTVSQDQLKKLQDKLRKCQTEVEGTREKYTAAVNDLNGYNAKYIEDMSEVYQRCQEFEQKRIEFFKKTLFQLHACLDLSNETRFSQIYTGLHATIGNMDYNKDLKWWSANYGVDMPMHWPMFEEYSPELQSISRRGKSNLNTGDGGIMVTSIKLHSREGSFGSHTNEDAPQMVQQQQHQNYDPPAPPSQQMSYNSQLSSNSYGASSSGGAADRSDSPINNGSAHVADNPFGDTDEDPAEEEPPNDGWVVRALYDYVKAEDDELEFKAGDIFTQIATADEMGWCKGQKDGKVGFYPKNYVERI